jgi:hypothetical protein
MTTQKNAGSRSTRLGLIAFGFMIGALVTIVITVALKIH